jgi:hypothetical protein
MFMWIILSKLHVGIEIEVANIKPVAYKKCYGASSIWRPEDTVEREYKKVRIWGDIHNDNM